MRIIATSDTHGRHRELEVPDGDIFIFCGDWTNTANVRDTQDFFEWVSKLPHRYKLVIAGNHDFYPMQEPNEFFKSIPTGVTYLEDEWADINGLNIYGAPWTPRFGDWAFMRERGAPMKRIWDRIPEDIDILVTHGPPAQGFDLTRRGVHAGCADLQNALLRVRPTLHLFGHIHEAYGAREVPLWDRDQMSPKAHSTIRLYNVSAVMAPYADHLPLNPPRIIEL